MADSVVKLRIDSKEYDANIKHASEALTQYFNRVRQGGGTLEYLDEGVMDAVKAMGELGTKSDSTRGAMRELLQATADMTVQYRSLTEAERATPLGEAMAQSIAQMTERAGELQDAMGEVSASIQHAASDTRAFDQIAGSISLMTSGFQTAVGAANLLGIEIGNQEKVLATLASAMSITNGLQTAQNLLQGQSALMMGVQAAQASIAAAAQAALAAATGSATIAQKAFNLVANTNPYVLLATAVAAVGTALYAFASASGKAEKEVEELTKAEEEATKKTDDARNAFVNASAEAMNSASRLSSLQVAYKNANSEIEKTNILKQAQEQFKKLGFECKSLNDAQNLLIRDGAKVIELIQLQGNVAALSAVRMEAFKNSFKMLMENGYSASAAATLAGYNKEVLELDGQITKMQGKIQGLKGSLPMAGGGKSGGNVSSASQTVKDEMSLNSQKISDLTNEYIYATNQRRTAIEEEIAVLQKRNEEIQKLKDMALGKTFDAGSLGEVIITGSKQKKEKPKEEKESKKNEVNLTKEIASMSGGDDLAKQGEQVQKAWSLAAQAVSSVGDAFNSIEDPGAKAMGIVLQAISSIALGFAQASASPAVTSTGWGWLAWLAAGTAAMATTISTVHSLTGFANGGVVDGRNGGFVGGTNFSGDNIGNVRLNAGELVLNQAQAGVIANALQDRDFAFGASLQPYVDGEKIFLGMNNTSKRMGRGEIVTTSTLRRLGLI